MASAPQGPPFLFSLIASGWLARCAHVATVLTIPDAIGDGEKTSAEIAQQLGTSEDFTFRLLRALAAGNIFEEVGPKKFKNNVNSQILRTGSPPRDMLLMVMGQTHSRSWLELLSAVKTGKSGVTQAFGVDFWQYTEKDKHEFDLFNQAMVSMTETSGPVIAGHYDWTRFKKLLDLGGGHGGLLKHLHPKHSKGEWAIADLPSVCAVVNEKAPKGLIDAGVKWIPTDFFASVPSGFDAVIMKHILHDWGDEASKKILANIRKGIPSDGIVLIIETIVPERAIYNPANPQAGFIPLMDMNMMAMCEGGRERTVEEWKALAAATGFRVGSITACPPTSVSIIEFIPI